MWLALGTLGLAAMGIGIYVWFQLQTDGRQFAGAQPAAQPEVAQRPGPERRPYSPPAVPLTPRAVKSNLPPIQALTATGPGQETGAAFAPRRKASPLAETT